jgi:hypothetical protein
LALLAWLRVPAAGNTDYYLALFASAFVTFFPAIVGHPAHTRSGSRFMLDPRALRAAEPWTLVLAGSCVAALLTVELGFFWHGDAFRVTSASLVGRVDRQLDLCCLFATFHALTVACASSGLRWTPTSMLSPSSALSSITYFPAGAPFAQPGSALICRTAKVGWLFIAGEVASVLLVFVGTREGLLKYSSIPHASLLPLLLLALPAWHAFMKLYGRTTFLVRGGVLQTRHFPFSSRDRDIPTRDIRGIQVNAELNEEGVVSHYSLLLVGQHSDTDRLVDDLPSAEHATRLAEQLDMLVRQSV